MTWDNMILQEIVNLTGVSAVTAGEMTHTPARLLYLESINRVKAKCLEHGETIELKKRQAAVPNV